jgi:hypothetical protein
VGCHALQPGTERDRKSKITAQDEASCGRGNWSGQKYVSPSTLSVRAAGPILVNRDN